MSISIPKLDRCEYLTEKTLDGEPRRARRGVVGLLHAAADPRSEETAPVTPEKRSCSNGCKTSTRCACTIHRKAVCRPEARKCRREGGEHATLSGTAVFCYAEPRRGAKCRTIAFAEAAMEFDPTTLVATPKNWLETR